MSEGEIIPASSVSAIMPVMDVGAAVIRYKQMVDFVRQVMEPDVDFGNVPGTTKPTLLKPGAEKLCTFFGLSSQFDVIGSIEDWTGRDHGEPLFSYTFKCRLLRIDQLVAEGVGSCNSWEKKYRYRQADRICPKCGKSAIIKGKEEYGGGWLCFAKKGGCGAKWPDGAAEIESQAAGMVTNTDPADLLNTLQKMAQKRALVAATLVAVNASAFFTQDLEEIAGAEPVGTTVVPPARPVSAETPQGEPPKPANGNGRKIDKATEYWTAVKRAKLSTAEGKQILAECSGDLDIARKKVGWQYLGEDEQAPF